MALVYIMFLNLRKLKLSVNKMYWYAYLQLKGRTLVRYIEGGSYRGFMKSSGKTLVANKLGVADEGLLFWEVYNQHDLLKRRQFLDAKPKKG